METTNKIIIAIDGHSSTGKSTVAKQLAKALNYTYVDTGAMYRSVAWYALQKGFIGTSLHQQDLIKALSDIEIRFQLNSATGVAEAYLNGVNVEKEIRSMKVSNWVSPVSAISQVRAKLVEQQRQMSKDRGLVMDGRDIGTVVFPDAELKLYMTASAEVRAQRRFDELKAKGDIVSFEEVLQNVKQRDHIDSTRKDSPLVAAKEAVIIDNSDLSKENQFQMILKLANQAINNKS